MRGLSTAFDPAYARSSYKPSIDNTYDLGEAALAFRTGYFKTSILFTNTSSFSIMAASGDAGILKLSGGDSVSYVSGAGMNIEGVGAAGLGRLQLWAGAGSAGISFDTEGATRWVIDASGFLRSSNTDIRVIANNGTNKAMFISADSNGSAAANLNLYSDDTNGGDAELQSGVASGADVSIKARGSSGVLKFSSGGGLLRWTLSAAGHLIQDGTNGGLISFNRANTTMEFVGAMGNSSKNPAVDAAADWVEIVIGVTTYYLPAYAA